MGVGSRWWSSRGGARAAPALPSRFSRQPQQKMAGSKARLFNHHATGLKEGGEGRRMGGKNGGSTEVNRAFADAIFCARRRLLLHAVLSPCLALKKTKPLTGVKKKKQKIRTPFYEEGSCFPHRSHQLLSARVWPLSLHIVVSGDSCGRETRRNRLPVVVR